jgi:hypothetical protein
LFRCTVKKNKQGHGGLNPTKGTPVSALSAFIAEVEKSNIFKADFAPEVRATFERHAPYMTFPLNVLFGNLPIFAPLIKKIMAGIPQASAMLATGILFPSIHAGDPELPHISANHAQAHMFLRCIREETMYRELEQIKKIDPDGIMLSNGPGDPEENKEIIANLKEILDESEYPVLGICLGHQLMALAYGAKTEKLKFGHRGGNQPVFDLNKNRIFVPFLKTVYLSKAYFLAAFFCNSQKK